MKSTPAGIELTIDGKRCTVAEGVTLLEAANQQGIAIPTLCHHPALSAWGGCRLCVVEVDRAPRLVASCVTPVRRGMDVVTTNERIQRYRRTMVEFLLAERNHNCMFCPQSGDCELQSLAYALGVDHLSVPASFESFATDVTSADMAIDHNRCVLCGRCVRACREIAACQVLGFHHRGEKTMVGLDLNALRAESDCLGCGVCLQVCPTGAMTSRHRPHYAVKGHALNWQTREDFCPLCGLMCPTVSRVRDNQLLGVDGILGLRDGRPDGGQLCRRGRFEPLKDPGPRLTTPMVRDDAGRWVAVSWPQAVDAAAAGLDAVRQRQGTAALFGLASSQASNEVLVMFKLLVNEAWQAGHLDTCDGDLCRGVTAVLGADGEKPWQESSWERLGAADMVLVIGADLDRESPLLASVLRRRQREAGIAMAVVGGQALRGPIAVEHLGVPDSELAAQIRSLGVAAIKGGAAGPQTLDRVARDYTAAAVPLIITGAALTGPYGQDIGVAVVDLARLRCHGEARRLPLVILKGQGNSAGAWRLGMAAAGAMPDPARCRGGIVLLADTETALWPRIAAMPPGAFLTVLTPWMPAQTATVADVLLPIPSWLETEGSYCTLDGAEMRRRRPTLAAPAGVPPTWQTLGRLADRAGWSAGPRTWADLCQMVDLGPLSGAR